MTYSTDKVTRVEIIDENGRSYTNFDPNNKVELSFQDNERTLKVFISRVNPDEREPHSLITKTLKDYFDELEKMTDLERLKLYDEEISKEMPLDFKDFWENSKDEWPLVTRLVLEGRREQVEWCNDVIDKQALKIKELEEEIEYLRAECAGEDL
jgi:hypothetical protein